MFCCLVALQVKDWSNVPILLLMVSVIGKCVGVQDRADFYLICNQHFSPSILQKYEQVVQCIFFFFFSPSMYSKQWITIHFKPPGAMKEAVSTVLLPILSISILGWSFLKLIPAVFGFLVAHNFLQEPQNYMEAYF